jgi:hypothetical protein
MRSAVPQGRRNEDTKRIAEIAGTPDSGGSCTTAKTLTGAD